MTDISNWHELVHVGGVRATNIGGGRLDFYCYYAMVPLNSYQMANLLDALTQAQENGDWHGELCDVIAVAMDKMGIDQLTSNGGKTFTLEKVKRRDLST